MKRTPPSRWQRLAAMARRWAVNVGLIEPPPPRPESIYTVAMHERRAMDRRAGGRTYIPRGQRPQKQEDSTGTKIQESMSRAFRHYRR